MPLPRVAHLSLRANARALLCAGLLALTVCGDPVGPQREASSLKASFAFAPTFPVGAATALHAAAIDVDNVHIVIRRDDNVVVLDTTVNFPPGVDAISFQANVPLRGLTELFSAQIQLRSGSMLLYEGTQQVQARAGQPSAQTVAITTRYAGPGVNATKVALSPKPVALITGSTVQLKASITDGTGSEIAGVPLIFTSSDATIATVSASGLVTALSKRGSATITAALLSGLSDNVGAAVTLPPATTRIVSGGGQTGRAGEVLAQPLIIEVDAADGVATPGVTVNFRAVTGNGSVSPASGITDAAGRVSTTITLGGSVGAQAFEATATPLTAVPIAATATAGLPSTVSVVTGNTQSDTVGRTLALPFVAKVSDKFGNAVGGVTVNWQRVSGGGTVANATTTTDATGITSTTYKLGPQAGVETISATAAAGVSTTFSATAFARPPATIVAASPVAQNGTVGTAISPVSVLVTNTLGEPAANVTVSWTSSGSVLLAAATSVTGADGKATMSGTYATLSGAASITASFAGSAVVKFELNANAGAVSQLSIVAGDGQTAAPGSPVAIAPAVRVRDGFGNTVSENVVFTVLTGGGSVTGNPAHADAAGVATLTSWTLGPAGAQSLRASVGAAIVTFAATSSGGAPPILDVIEQPSGTQKNALTLQSAPQVQLKTSAGSAISQSGVPITVALVNAGQVLSGTLTASTGANGRAIFNGLTITGPIGPNQLTFSSPGYTSATSATITLQAGTVTEISAVTALSFAGTAGALASPNPQVLLKDVSGNPVSLQSVVFSVPNAASGSVAGSEATSNASGVAAPTSWTLDAVAGKDTLAATFPGATGSPVKFEAVTSAGTPTQIAIVSGNNQSAITGQAVAQPLVVEARDAQNNPVPGVSITYTILTGGGTPATQTIATGINGRASAAWTVGAVGSQTMRAALPSGTPNVTFSALAIPVGADVIWTGATSSNWTVGTNWSPAVAPTASSKIFIPVTATAPVFSGPVAVSDLTIADGQTVNIASFNLDVSGNLLATGATLNSSGGVVRMNGAGKQLAAATMPGLVIAGGSTTVVGTTVIAGDVTITNGASFDAGAATVVVSGSLSLSNNSGSRFKMNNANAHVVITGDAYFNATDMGDGDLTAGVLELKGNFTAQQSFFQAFRATGTHTTRFSGTTLQSVFFYYPSDGQSKFQNLDIANNAGVAFTNNTVAAGDVNVFGSSALSGGKTLSVGGLLSSDVNTSLGALANMVVYGTNAAVPKVFGVAPPMTYLSSANVIGATYGSWTFPGSLSINNGTTLNMGNNTLTVTGSFTLENGSGARLRMVNGGGHLNVNGDVYFNAADMGDLDLTAGTLDIKGNFTAQQQYFQSFRAAGSHTTRFSGTVQQHIFFYYPGSGQSRFQNAVFANPAGVVFDNNVVANGTTSVTSATSLSGNSGLFVGGLVTTQNGTSLAGLLSLNVYAGVSFPNIAGVAAPETYLSSATVIPALNGTLPGNLSVNNGTTLDIGATNLTVTGNLTYHNGSGARLKMNNAAGRLVVGGNAYFNAADMGESDLTAGTLEFRGNFVAQQNYFQAFRATGTHLTRFNGTTAQTIFTYYPGATHSQFQNVQFTNAAGIALSSELVANGTVLANGATSITGGQRIDVGGLLTTAAGTSLAGLSDVVVYNSGNTFPLMAGVAPPMMYLASGGTIPVPAGSTALPGGLTVTSGTTLDIGANTLIIAGSLTLANISGARLKMNNAAGHLIVGGDAYFNASDMGDGDLTAGTLDFKGNFVAQQNFFQAFRATGTHLTRFVGTSPQNIFFYYPGATHSQFQNAEFSNAAGVTLGNTAVAGGNLNVTGTTSVSGAALYVSSQITTSAGTSLASVNDVVIYGASATFPLFGGSAPANLSLASGSVVSAPASPTIYPGSLTVTSGTTLDIGASTLTVNGALTYPTNSGARLKMTNSLGHFTVGGTAYFNAADMGDGDLTAGTLEFKGNFVAQQNFFQSFRATGAHVTKFSGTSAQDIFFYYPGTNTSRFQSVVFANASVGGVTSSNNYVIAADAAQNGRLSVPTSLSIAGSLSLGSTSTTSVSGALSAGSCVYQGGATFTGFSCSPAGGELKAGPLAETARTRRAP